MDLASCKYLHQQMFAVFNVLIAVIVHQLGTLGHRTKCVEDHTPAACARHQIIFASDPTVDPLQLRRRTIVVADHRPNVRVIGVIHVPSQLICFSSMRLYRMCARASANF